MADRYKNFAELSAAEREGVDFRVRCTIRNPPVAIIAPHGGGIEPGTSEIASEIAGSVYSVYCFEGLKPSGNSVLHITSTRFDEPRCVDLVSASDFVVSVHGLAGTYEGIDVGGLDQSLREAICGSLVRRGLHRSGGNDGRACRHRSCKHLQPRPQGRRSAVGNYEGAARRPRGAAAAHGRIRPCRSRGNCW